MPGATNTRASAHTNMTDLIGSPEDLPLADLPTRRNVLQKMILEKVQDPRDYRHITNMELAIKVGKAVMTLWTRLNPTIEIAMVK